MKAKSTLTHIVNYEKTIFEKKIIGKEWHDFCQFKKTSNILRSKKIYGLKISQSINYVKECFHMFVSALKNIIETYFRGMLFNPYYSQSMPA